MSIYLFIYVYMYMCIFVCIHIFRERLPAHERYWAGKPLDCARGKDRFAPRTRCGLLNRRFARGGNLIYIYINK